MRRVFPNPVTFVKIVEGFRKLEHQGSELKNTRTGFITVMFWHKMSEFVAMFSMRSENSVIYLSGCSKSLRLNSRCLARQCLLKLFVHSHGKQGKDVDEQNLTSFVMPLQIELCFAKWWKGLPPNDDEVLFAERQSKEICRQ